MEANPGLLAVASLLMVLGNAFFVSAEYALIGARRTGVEALAKRGDRQAKRLLLALDDLSSYVAACQIGITMLGIATGAIAEPFVTSALQSLGGPGIPAGVGYAVSFFVVTLAMVILGELCPKYLVLRNPVKVAHWVAGPLGLFVAVFRPLVWITEGTAGLILKPFHVNLNEQARPVVARDELEMLVREGGQGGILATEHAALVARALKFDQLDARDIMVHRLDIKWIDLSLGKDALLSRLRKIPFTRLPVCRGDIDDLAGIVYLHDIVKNLSDPDFSLERIIRPAVIVPENLPIDRVLEQMRHSKTQLVIVMDEYGGTSGLVTLEDVVEEVFGELEDTLESERPAIERLSESRVSARAETRYDELLDFLHRDAGAEPNTDTLATLIIEGLGHVPRPGDSVECPLGTLRVENMARRRITRVSVYLKPA